MKVKVLILFILIFFLNFKVFSTPVRLTVTKYSSAGSGALIANSNNVLTAAHIITSPINDVGGALKEQIEALRAYKAVFVSPPILIQESNGGAFIEGAILIPKELIKFEILDSKIPPLRLPMANQKFNYLSGYFGKTGIRENLLDINKFKTPEKGDSGSVVYDPYTLTAVMVVFGNKIETIQGKPYNVTYFISLDGSNVMIDLLQSPGRLELIRRQHTNAIPFNNGLVFGY